MQLTLRWLALIALLALLALPSTPAEEIPGICTRPHVVEKKRYVMDRSMKAWRVENYNVTVMREECCNDYYPEKQSPLTCKPLCDPPCENSDCELPDTCVCHPGHVPINNSSYSCHEVCDACVYGACVTPNATECTCDTGYKLHPTLPHICDPVCTPSCVNGSCAHPDSCRCFNGYKPRSFNDHICVPECTEGCVFGTCTAPEVCTCDEGYINDKESPSICLPVCNFTCVNGDCYAPDMCKCRVGFNMDPSNPYLCVPQTAETVKAPENSCMLKLPRAVKIDSDSDCFVMKKAITLNVPGNCRVIHRRLESFCSHVENCHHSECVLNFRCSAQQFSGSNEIHCYLEDDFETDSTDGDNIITNPEWSDVVLVVYSLQNLNLSVDFKENVTKQWTFKPSIKSAVCGMKHFAVEMMECEAVQLPSLEENHLNSTFMFWMNVILISGLVLMVAVGVGGFLWARHRRLNNPLNYREDMNQGYYNNQCYDGDQPVELISDDDSEPYSEAPL